MFDLENLDKTEHYKIPENYFDELPGRVMQNIKHEQQHKRTIITSAVAAVAVLAIAVVIMVRGAGLSEELDFGAGAYYYADIPDFEKYVGGESNPTSIPLIVYIALFLGWGALMFALWKWIDRH